MTDADDYTPYGDKPPSQILIQLRLHAEQLARDKADVDYLGLLDQLRGDEKLWPHLWAPSAALAASRSGRCDAVELLREAVADGFSQPELFEGEIEEHFGGDPSWLAIAAQMEMNVPPPALTLLEWPDAGVSLPLHLLSIAPERADSLRDRLPTPPSSSWETATRLLDWVRRRWDHANDHVDDPDALEVLERVDRGERFACVEYSIVLSQALNAVGIPARRVDLRQRNHHFGVGRGHVVSEAWIDDLDSWIVLDGQNGAYWAGDDEGPLGLRELQRRYATGEQARMVCLVDDISAEASASWRTYFASASATGYAWAEGPFSPVFQDMGIIKTQRLLHGGDLAYPSLSAVSIGLTGTLAQPAVRLHSEHPYAQGFRVEERGTVAEVPLVDARWPLFMAPGIHEVEIATRTPYGHTTPGIFTYEVR